MLGDWVAFCLGCGAAQRWFEEFEAAVLLVADLLPEQPAQASAAIRARPKNRHPIMALDVRGCEGSTPMVRSKIASTKRGVGDGRKVALHLRH